MDEFVPLDTHFKDEKMSDQKALAYLAETFRSFLNGQYLPSLDLKVRDSIESCDLKELFDFVATSLSGYNKGVQAIKSISDGDLNFEITLPSPILEPVKILQAKLKHLIWQTQMIAAGDYSHHIDFIGDFSTSFNQLIHSLQKRQDLEQKLVESQRKFQLITENSNDVIWIMDVATRKFTYISPSVYKLRGLTVEEAMSETFEQSMTPESALKANQKFELLHTKIKNNQPMPDSYDEFQQWCKNGQVIDIEVSTKLIYDQNGQPKEILGLSRDITERKKAEKALMKSEEKLTQLLALQSSKNRQLISHLQYIYNNANNSIAFFDIKGDTIKFSSCNKRWANNNGFEPEDLVGFDISGMPDQETATLYRKYIQKVSETKQPLQDYIIWHNLHIHIIVT